MVSDKPIILWFRADLRLRDNPALKAAHETGRPIIPLFILEDEDAGEWKRGGASRWWLYHSLSALNQSCDGKLVYKKGAAADVLMDVIGKTGAGAVYWNRCYENWRVWRDSEIKAALKDNAFEVESFNGSLLFEPHTTLKDDGTPYKVFSAFYKNGCLKKRPDPRAPTGTPRNIHWRGTEGLALKDLGLLPDIKWYDGMAAEWTPGEEGAHKRLNNFLKDGLQDYKNGRDFPALENVSRLSPHLHFGEISPNEVWYRAKEKFTDAGWNADGEHFLRELGWREFSNNLLFFWPDLPRENLQEKFNDFPWRNDKVALRKWQKGQTGYPIVDAGMRQLWQTGWMHNRVRMIVASFLIKNLMIHWHEGEDWFWDCLVDADLANNSASWQWVAGTGADAAPYFRIFNPVTQSQKFDKGGEYIRRFVPELKDVPDKYIHAPWEAGEDVLKQAGVELGKDYPEPMVDLKETRERALAAFKGLKG